ncbi:MAG: hypothetical protein LBM16_00820, partial [Clostridiales bacterium]|nr:hypothetical protein [Clostridiales bacterium]
IFCGDSAVIVGDGRKYTAFGKSGNELRIYDAVFGVRDLRFSGGTDKLLVAGELSAGIYNAHKEKELPLPSTP